MTLQQVKVLKIPHSELTYDQLRLMYCVFNPKYKTDQAQYKWIKKQCRKYADKCIGKHIICHFEFSKRINKSYLTVRFNGTLWQLSCDNNFFIEKGLTEPHTFN